MIFGQNGKFEVVAEKNILFDQMEYLKNIPLPSKNTLKNR
jgi:hypothetical protein